MITNEDFRQVNFTVWCCDTPKENYTFQWHRGLGADPTIAGKRGNPVLICGDRLDEITDVKDFDDALRIINERQEATPILDRSKT